MGGVGTPSGSQVPLFTQTGDPDLESSAQIQYSMRLRGLTEPLWPKGILGKPNMFFFTAWLIWGHISRGTFHFPSFQGSGSFWKTSGNPGKTKERWLKRMGNQPLEHCLPQWQSQISSQALLVLHGGDLRVRACGVITLES